MRPLENDISPFAGWRYNPEVVGEIDKVLAPPYDMIPSPLKQTLLQQSPFNITHLTLGEGEGNWYQSAARRLEDWLEKGVLKRDPAPQFYLYRQAFNLGGTNFVRTGVIGVKRVDELGSQRIFKHERTFEGPKNDRYNLLQAVQSHLEPIFALCDVPEEDFDSLISAIIKETAPYFTCIASDGVAHTLWGVNQSHWVSELAGLLSYSPAIIADGHHRFEVACKYAHDNNLPAGHPGSYVLMYFANLNSEGLVILPTHRLIKLPWVAIETALEKATEIFQFEDLNCPLQEMIAQLQRTSFPYTYGFYSASRRALFRLRSEDILIHAPELQEIRNSVLRQLKVNIIHKLFLERYLGLGWGKLAEYVEYFRHPEEAAKRVDEGKAGALILLKPTSLYEVKMVAQAGEVMPHKSTDFFPKLASGLVIYRF